MSREHKYKVWDKELKKILPVVIINFEDGIVQAKHSTSSGTSFSGTYEIRTLPLDSLIESTGLKVNGKELYVDDILSYPDTESEYVDVGIGRGGVKVAEQNLHSFFPVEMKNGQYGIEVKGNYVETLDSGWHSLKDIFEEFDEKDLEIIGNVFENPTLLDNKEEL